jgi:hypothetical protein
MKFVQSFAMDLKVTQPVPLITPRLDGIGDKRKVPKKGVNPLLSLFAGSIAGGVEAAITVFTCLAILK